jgi:hypothetical protein
MNELVRRIGLPVRRFPSTGDYHAGTIRRAAWLAFNRGGKMHEQGHRTEDTLGVIHKANQLAQRGLASQIQYALQSRMIVVLLPDLDEEDFPAEMIGDRLPSAEMPPFDRVVELSSGYDDPAGDLATVEFFRQRRQGFFGLGEVNIPAKLR